MNYKKAIKNILKNKDGITLNINGNGFNNSISNELLKIKVMNRLKSFAGDY